MITKKHFNKIAEIIKSNIPDDRSIKKGDMLIDAIPRLKFVLVTQLADFFESDNSNFHRGKFIHACYNKAKNKAA